MIEPTSDLTPPDVVPRHCSETKGIALRCGDPQIASEARLESTHRTHVYS